MTEPDPIRGARPSDPAEGPAPDDDPNSPDQQREEPRANPTTKQPPLEDSPE
jgi:hypothetical protein